MSNHPENLRYTAEHVWVRDNGNGTFTVGVTDFAQNALNDVVFVQLPLVDTAVVADEAIGLLESVKSASDVFAPVSGNIVQVNEKLALSPELINTHPYDEGWLFQICPNSAADVNQLLNFNDYQKIITV
ncbi:glycine cleavage system protein GcvH [Simonsiella muelleri]|uniref:glycine cleavage system protein GcvH n=1 Tax=Simonsiella muelleri TaxID=72 RepID=UPI0028D83C6F|nr:glycine cleavage system protein GcvH [Simonsiella muelleri]